MAFTYMHVTVAGAGDKSGSSWANAMGYAEFETDFEGSSAAEDIYIVKEGTYTLTSDMAASGRNGTTTDVISVWGVKSATTNEGAAVVASDLAYGTARPLFAGGADYGFEVGSYWELVGIRVTTSKTGRAIYINAGSKVSNCYASNTSASADQYALYANGVDNMIENNELICTNGYAAFIYDEGTTLQYNYIHDSKVGMRENARLHIFRNTFDTCTTGISIAGRLGCCVNGNVVYNCTDGISILAGYSNHFTNNSITDCVDGVASATKLYTNFFDYNNWYNNTNDINGGGAEKGMHATAVDPEYTDAPNGDFSTDATSAMRGAGLSYTIGT